MCMRVHVCVRAGTLQVNPVLCLVGWWGLPREHGERLERGSIGNKTEGS